jgi:hypothetical protein
MYEYWKGLEPEEVRIQKSVMTRWSQMISIFKFVVSFNDHRIAGSTGRGNWFRLSPDERNEFLQAKAQKEKGFKKVLIITNQTLLI